MTKDTIVKSGKKNVLGKIYFDKMPSKKNDNIVTITIIYFSLKLLHN